VQRYTISQKTWRWTPLAALPQEVTLYIGAWEGCHTEKQKRVLNFAGIWTRLGKATSMAPVSVTDYGGVGGPSKFWMGLGDSLPDVQPWSPANRDWL